MTNFDYYIKNPDRAFIFTTDGFQLTPMAKTAINIDAISRSQLAKGDAIEKEKVKKALIKAMKYRLEQEAINYIRNDNGY